MIKAYIFNWRANIVEECKAKVPNNRFYYCKDLFHTFWYKDRNGNNHQKTLNQIPKKFRTALLLEGLL